MNENRLLELILPFILQVYSKLSEEDGTCIYLWVMHLAFYEAFFCFDVALLNFFTNLPLIIVFVFCSSVKTGFQIKILCWSENRENLVCVCVWCARACVCAWRGRWMQTGSRTSHGQSEMSEFCTWSLILDIWDTAVSVILNNPSLHETETPNPRPIWVWPKKTESVDFPSFRDRQMWRWEIREVACWVTWYLSRNL